MAYSMAYSKLFFAQIKRWLGEQQTLNTFNVGTTLLF
jgi:hypothetical protein